MHFILFNVFNGQFFKQHSLLPLKSLTFLWFIHFYQLDSCIVPHFSTKVNIWYRNILTLLEKTLAMIMRLETKARWTERMAFSTEVASCVWMQVVDRASESGFSGKDSRWGSSVPNPLTSTPLPQQWQHVCSDSRTQSI